jgi:thiamine-phosphate pyrophosphorylase
VDEVGAQRDPKRVAGLHVLADDDPRWRNRVLAQARAACAGGAAVVQLRAKHATDREALALAREIRELTRKAGLLFVLNDRFDLALASGADAVHLGQDDFPPARIPASARAALLVGRSTHTLEQVQRARGEGVDYLGFGPVFGTTSKESAYSARGAALLAKAVECAGGLPVIAIGGIDAARAAEAAKAGAAGVAVISAVADALDPERAVRELVSGLGRSAA